MPPVDERPQVPVRSRAGLRAWLHEHHDRHPGAWLVIYKRHHPDYLPWPEVVQELLCFGWIDSRTRRLDDDRTLLLVGPRRPGSMWSAVNKAHVARLVAEGRMTPAGQARVDAARADGSWSFLDDIDALVEPEDLRAALDREPAARAGWEGLPASTRKRVLYWLKSARTAATRQRRLAEIARQAVLGRAPQ